MSSNIIKAQIYPAISVYTISFSLSFCSIFFPLTLTTAGSGQASCSEHMNPHTDVLQLYRESRSGWTVKLILDCTCRKWWQYSELSHERQGRTYQEIRRFSEFYCSAESLLPLFSFRFLFISLPQVLVAPFGSFDLSCGVWDLLVAACEFSCGMGSSFWPCGI